MVDSTMTSIPFLSYVLDRNTASVYFYSNHKDVCSIFIVQFFDLTFMLNYKKKIYITNLYYHKNIHYNLQIIDFRCIQDVMLQIKGVTGENIF